MPRTLLDHRAKRTDPLRRLIAGYKGVSSKTGDDLGRLIGVSRVTVWRHLSDLENIPLGELLNIARGLNVPIDELRTAIRYQ